MKKVLFILIAMASFSLKGQAQLYLIDKFTLADSDSEYGIYMDIDVKEGEKILYDLQAYSPEQMARAELSANEVKSFISSLEKTIDVYEKWSKIARNNNYKLLSKRFPTTFADQNIYFTQENKWYIEKGVDMWAMFFVDAEGDCHLILESDYMTSSELAATSSSVGLSFAGSLLRSGIIGISSEKTKIEVGRYCGGSSLSFKSSDEVKEFIKKLQDALVRKMQNITDGKNLK